MSTHDHDDARRVTPTSARDKAAVRQVGHDELLARRLAPERQQADLVVLDQRLEDLDDLPGDKALVLAARELGGGWAALALFDDAASARRFLRRFHDTGVPTIWPARAIVALQAFGLDLTNADTRAKVADQPRATWLRVVGENLVDQTRRPVVAGAGRAARRRAEHAR